MCLELYASNRTLASIGNFLSPVKTEPATRSNLPTYTARGVRLHIGPVTGAARRPTVSQLRDMLHARSSGFTTYEPIMGQGSPKDAVRDCTRSVGCHN